MGYCYKVWQMGKVYKTKYGLESVWKNVLFIMNRIVLITLSYLFVAWFVNLSWHIMYKLVTEAYPGPETELFVTTRTRVELTICIAMWLSLSMFMMMEYNEAAYIRFLKVVQVTRFKYICFCCYQGVVDRQLKELTEEQSMNSPKSVTRST